MTVKLVQQSQEMGFSDIEVSFVAHLVRTGDKSKAQKLSGIDPEHIKVLLCREAYGHLIRIQGARMFIEELAPAALARLKEFSEKGNCPDRGQLDAIKTILDRVGFIAPKAREPEKHNLEPQEMSEQQLRDVVTKLTAELVKRDASNAQPVNDQAFDILS